MISEEDIDRTLSDTFPASDSPSWTLGIERATHIDQSEHETQEPGIPDPGIPDPGTRQRVARPKASPD
jgi:hypothetical protein